MSQPLVCPHCLNDNETMIDRVGRDDKVIIYLCVVCSKTFEVKNDSK
jgi:transposase-like protein